MEQAIEELDETTKDLYWDDAVDECIRQAKSEAFDMGFEIEQIHFQGFCSQGDGASWVGLVHVPAYIEHKLANGGIPGIPDVTLEVMYWVFKSGLIDEGLRVTQRGHYVHDKTMDLSDFYPTGYENNETLGQWAGPFSDTPVRELLDATGWEKDSDSNHYAPLWHAILEDTRSFARKVYDELDGEHSRIYYGE